MAAEKGSFHKGMGEKFVKFFTLNFWSECYPDLLSFRDGSFGDVDGDPMIRTVQDSTLTGEYSRGWFCRISVDEGATGNTCKAKKRRRSDKYGAK